MAAPAILLGIQAVYMLVGFAVDRLTNGNESALWRWGLWGAYLTYPVFGGFLAVVFPIAAFKYGKRISLLESTHSKLLFSVYNSVVATASFGWIYYIVNFRWLFITSVLVWVLLWTLLPALLHKERTEEPADADAMVRARETDECK